MSNVTSIAPLSVASRRELLANALQEAANTAATYPLSFAQQRLWFLEQLEPGSSLYNLASAVRITGTLDRAALEKAFKAVIDRHEILRSRFLNQEDGPVQRVLESVEFELGWSDMSSLNIADRESGLDDVVQSDIARRFDLASEPPIRARLVRVGPDCHQLVTIMHHMVSDEWSLRVFYNELFAFYGGFIRHAPVRLPELPIQYADFATWQRGWMQGPVQERQLDFWREHLSGLAGVTELPSDLPRPPAPSFSGRTEYRVLPAQLSAKLREVTEQQRVTPFMFLLAAINALIHRYTQQEDIIIGAPIAGRTRAETEGLIGFFVNTLPLRTRLSGGTTFRELLAQVRETTLAACANQDVPFERIVEALRPERSLSHMPFTRVMFVFQNAIPLRFSSQQLEIQPVDLDSQTAKFDVTLTVQETSSGFRLGCEYCSDLFSPETAKAWLEHLENLLAGVAADPAVRVSELPLLGSEERRRILQEWNATSTNYPRQSAVHQLFEIQAEKWPEKVAVSYGSTSLTYAELNGRANQLARYLRSLGVVPDTTVAVCVNRSVEMVVALLAVLKAGGAYVPVDAGYPRERLKFMLEDSEARILLTQQALLSSLGSNGMKAICLDVDWELVASESRHNLENVNAAEDLAYVTYTSGSTGQPKGVAVAHRGITRLVLNTNYVQLSPSERIAQLANISFDAATFEIWGALLNGGQVVGITHDVALSPKDFTRELREKEITTIFITTALFSQVAAEDPAAFATLKTVITGGEVLDPKFARAVLGSRAPQRLYNAYGPTENTTFSTWHWIREAPPVNTSIPIGRPIANTTVYILDQHLNPVPVGAPGELYTGGDGVARGYWNRPDLTRERFITNPFWPAGSGARLYKTGDLARYHRDGSIEFLGRIDEQVKIRGFRVELGEIESVLSHFPGVRGCAVAVKGSNSGSRKLIAYVIPEQEPMPNASQLRAFLAAKVPEYMLPSAFVQVRALPLTPNGKLDRKALPEPDQIRPELEKKYASPRDAVEEKLTRIWEQVLGLHPIGIEDKFFDLGGHSLLAVKVISQVEKAFGKKLRLATIFQTPTISQLAAIIREETREPAGSSSALVEIHSGGHKPPLFLVHGAGGGMFWGYVNLAQRLKQPVYGFKSRGLDGLEEWGSIEEIAAHYVADMRRKQPAGPYRLGGYCFGGVVAFEMARQLEAAGEAVSMLALMNCAPPNSSYTRIPWTPKWLVRLARNTAYWSGYFRSWKPAQRREFFRWKWDVLKNKCLRRGRVTPSGFSRIDVRNLVDLSSYTPEQQKVWEAHIMALVRYQPKPFGGRVHLFRSPGHPLWCSFEDDYGWGEFARGGVEVTTVEGAHERILEEPCVESLAAALAGKLKLDSDTSPAGDAPLSRMALLKGVAARASLVWLGVDGETWEVIAPAIENHGFSLANLFQHLAVLSTAAPKNMTGSPALEHPGATTELLPWQAPAPNGSDKGQPRGECEIRITGVPVRHLRELCAAEKVPPHLALLAAAKVLIFRYAMVDGELRLLPRRRPAGGDTMTLTCAVNELVLHTPLRGDMSYRAVLRGVNQASQATPAGQVAPDSIPLLRVCFAPADSHFVSGRSDLTLEFHEIDGGYAVKMTFNQAYFTEASARRILEHLARLVEGIAAQPDVQIGSVPLVSLEERQRMLQDWTHTTADYDLHKSYVAHFRETVRAHPAAVAAEFRGQQITYAELDEESNRLAHYLRSQGVGLEVKVGVCLERSLELLITLLAIWKAGGAYVPLDPAYPLERLAFMLSDSEARVLVGREPLLRNLRSAEAKVVLLDDPEVRHAIEQCSAEAIDCPTDGESLAYVIYTSGSTGTPKGVQIVHRSLLNHNFAVADAYAIRPGERVLQFTPISFDISVEEIFPTLLKGATLVFRTEEVLASTHRFLKFVDRQKVTVLNLPTAYWHELVEALQTCRVPPALRLVIIGGEKASDAAYRRWKNIVKGNVRLINTYGPTEATVIATMYEARDSEDVLPIGRPLPNVQTLVLDEGLQPMPVGMVGELYIGGEGVSRGYYNRPEMNEHRFVHNPFQPSIPGARLYRTGDLVRLREDGNLEFAGRIDNQVKFRGYRIELGEIETALRSHASVMEAAVTVREDKPGDKRLIAYYVPRESAAGNTRGLRQFLVRKLPEYMVPTTYVALSAFPLTPAGKIDRANLPEPGNNRPEMDQPYVAPRTPLEQVVANIWGEVLGINEVGVFDSFFDLGGHSLLATQVMSRVREALQVDLALASLFESRTVAAFCDSLTENTRPVLPWSSLVRTPRLPLTATQQRIWFLDQFDPRQCAYSLPLLVRLNGDLDVEALRKSIAALADRHEALRAVFPAENGEPVQYLCEPAHVHLRVRDLSDLPADERQEKAIEAAAVEARRTSLTTEPVFKPWLFRLSNDRHLLLLVLHEIVADHASLRSVYRDLNACYEAFSSGRTPSLPQVSLRYSEALERLRRSDEYPATLQYWRETLAGAPEVLDLPADRSRPPHRSDTGARLPFEITPELARQIEDAAKAQNLDSGSILIAAFTTLLHRYTGVCDLVVGTTFTLRDSEVEDAVAPFSNLLPLRLDIAGSPSFADVAQQTFRRLREGSAQAEISLATLVDAMEVRRNPSHNPLFQVSIQVARHPEVENLVAGGLHLEPVDLDFGTARTDLTLRLARTGQTWRGVIEYSTDLFDPSRMSRFASHFQTLLHAAVSAPDARVSNLRLMPDEELNLVTSVWNETATPWPETRTLFSLFADQARTTPSSIALVDGTQRLSYGELADRAAALAAALKAKGAEEGTLVGICLERSWKMVAAILATLRLGAAYVPLDPAYPKDRLETILKNSKAAFILTEAGLEQRLPSSQAATVLVLEDSLWDNKALSTEPASLDPASLAYVIYTSGSTGVPKGVAITHRNAVAFVSWARRAFKAEELRGVLASTSICFDLSIFEIFVPLSSGGTVILSRNALALADLPARLEVTLVNTVPSAMQELLRARAVPASVRVINLAGEPLQTSLVDRIYAETTVEKVFDLYGPSETTTYSTGGLRRPGQPATIGRPLENEQAYVLDSSRQPVPIGVPGELWISGAGVALGYLHQPELTAERFLANPFRSNTRMYRTGDLARWQEDGTLEYLGRLDNQVKIRGFRIELGEIEACLRKTPGVKDAVVVARQYGAGDTRLVAYVVSELPRNQVGDGLRRALRGSLPEYMVPASFIVLDRLPLTPNGKIDRKALPDPRSESSPEHQKVVDPRTPLETRLLQIFREVLASPTMGVQDNFFDVGGNSLLAIRVISRVREDLKVELPLFALFDHPTVETIAAEWKSVDITASQLPVPPLERAPRDQPLPVSFVQERLWFLDQFQPGSDAYNVPAALRLTGRLDADALSRAFDAVVRRQEALRTRFVYRDGVLVQEFLEPEALRLEPATIDDTSEQGVIKWAETQARKPFDLATGPLLRAYLASLGPEDNLLVVVMHHSISDGWSVGLFFQELEAFYSAAVQSQSGFALPELPLQYVDYAHWQRMSLRGPLLEQELAFWKNALAGAPESTALPVDQGADGGAGSAGHQVLRLSDSVRQAIAEFTQKEGLTPFILLLAALKLTLYRWSGQRDLVTGTVVAGRNRRELEEVIGCFMNFLPLRLKIRPGCAATEVLADLRKVVLEAQNHQDCPFEKIVEAINPARKGDQNPLYNVALLLQNFPAEMFAGDHLKVSPVPVTLAAPLLDLRFEAEDTPAGFLVRCEYRTDRFNPETVQNLLNSFELALEALVRDANVNVEKLPVAPALLAGTARSREAENHHDLRIVANFTAEPIEEPLRGCLREAELTAHIQFAGYNQVFQELLDSSGLLASNSRGANVVMLRLEDWTRGGGATNGSHSAPETLRRNAREFASAIRAAASRSSTPHLVYLCPSSPAFLAAPENVQLLADVERELDASLTGVPGLYLFNSAQLERMYPVRDYSDPSADELGHVPYTPVFYSALATAITRHFHALKRPAYKVIALDCDNTLWSGVCGEDGAAGIKLDPCRVALQEFMVAQQQAGMLLVLCSKNSPEDVEEVFNVRSDMPLRREHISASAVNWSPKSENLKQLARSLNLGLDSFIFVDDNPVECAEVEAGCPGVLTLQLPEDTSKIPGVLQRCWAFDHLKVTDEDRRRAEMYRQNRAREALRQDAPSLADFIAGLDLHIVIEDMRPEQISRVAQLSQRTNQFNTTTRRRSEVEVEQLRVGSQVLCVQVRDRFGDYGLVGAIICRERDAALDVDSFLLSCRVLGRGVEHKMLSMLGEAARARKLNWVDVHYTRTSRNKPAWDFLESVGAPFKQALNGGFLFRFPAGYASEVAFNPQAPSQVPEQVEDKSPSDIKSDPTAPAVPKFTRCRAIALETGDLQAWHARLSRTPSARAAASAQYSAPRTPLERQLCELWQKLLNVDRVGISDNFFDLGGHSLMAVRLFSEIGNLTGEKLPLVTLFQAPTVEQLAQLLHPEKGSNTSLLVPIQPRGSKPPLFLVHGAGGDVLWGYANLAAHLGDEQPVYGIKSRGQTGREEFATLEEMAAGYIAEIRSFQPSGPYYLGGYCFGGNVAYEMARQLEAMGETVGLVALLDSAPTNAGYETITWWEPSFGPRFLRNFGYWLEDFRRLKPQDRRRFFTRKARALVRKIRSKFGPPKAQLVDLEDVIDTGHFPSSELRLWQAHLEALVRHTDQPYEGPVALLRTRGQPLLCSLKEDFCWRKISPGLELTLIPGSHEEIFMEPHVRSLARQLTACLEQARLRAQSRLQTSPQS